MNYSNRGIQLIWQGKAEVPIVTLELYSKWYCIFIVYPNGNADIVSSDVVDKLDVGDRTLIFDHCFHPWLLEKVAEHFKGQVCELTSEIAAGRWMYKYHDSTPDKLS